MTLSISAIAGPTVLATPRTAAPTGVFALSMAQTADAPGTQHDIDPPVAPPKAKSDDDERQDDAADGNGLPLPTPVAPDPGLLAALLPPPAQTPPPLSTGVTVQATATGPDPVAGTPLVAPAWVANAPAPTAATPMMPVDAGDAASPVPAAPDGPAVATVSATTQPDPVAADLPVDPAIAAAQPVPVPAPSLLPLPSVPAAAAPIATMTPPLPIPNRAMPVQAASAPVRPVAIPDASPAATPIVELAAPVSTTGLATDAAPRAIAGTAPATAVPSISVPISAAPAAPVPTTPVPTTALPAPDAPPGTNTIQIDTRSAPVVALPPATPAAPLQGATGVATTTTSAIQAFGSAMRAGLAKDPRAAAGDDSAATPGHATTMRADQVPAVLATGDTQQAPLDLRREQWPHAMIDRIEALRDAADATSTKIRVVPDALGPVEMSVRKDGDMLHVHFTADQAATRAILTDAQPRLAAIAEQRGLRLGGSTVDGGSAGAGQQQQQTMTRQPAAPLPSPSVTAATAADDDDIRIA